MARFSIVYSEHGREWKDGRTFRSLDTAISSGIRRVKQNSPDIESFDVVDGETGDCVYHYGLPEEDEEAYDA